jgi:hypothetical protein
VLRIAKLRQRFRLDLTNSLASDTELASDFLKSAGLTVVKPKSHAKKFTFTIIEFIERFLDRFVEHVPSRSISGSLKAVIFDDVGEA